MSRLGCLLCIAVVAAPAAAGPVLKAPPGFKVEVVLEAPAIEAPTALCVAANGDVYFAEDPMDMRGPPTKNIDKIWLLKGGDPKKKVLVAENMWAVMGLEVVGDKLYVVHAPHVTVFTLDAEGKAKERKELFDDLGPPVAGLPSFNDHIPSGIRMGMDGWLYVSIGDKGIPKMARKELNEGSVHVAEGRWRRSKEGHHISIEGGGVIRFRPDGSGLEVFASGTRNHLDVPLDEHDRIFVRDNTDDGLGWWTRLMYLPPGGFLGYPWAYTKRPGECLPMVRDFGGGSPCGGWVYLDDGLPETYRGLVFHCEWGQGKVFGVKLAPDGAGFKFVNQITLLDPEGTGVKDFRPYTLRPTADGRGFYVTDWGFSGWLQNVKAGRLWKVTYTGDDVKPAPRGKDSDSVADLLKALDHPAHSERLRAQRALIARGKKGTESVMAAVRLEKLSAAGLRHAIWVLEGDSVSDWKGVQDIFRLENKLLAHRDTGVRVEAARAFQQHGPRLVQQERGGTLSLAPAYFRLVEMLDRDPDPHVRLHAALALEVLTTNYPLRWLDKEKDPYVRFALIQGMKKVGYWDALRQYLSTAEGLKKEPKAMEALIAALTEEYDRGALVLLLDLEKLEDSALRRQAVEALARVYKDRKPYAGTWWGTQPAAQKPPAREVAWEGTPQVRDAILAALADKDSGVRHAAIHAVVEMKDPKTLDPIIARFKVEKDEAARLDLVRAAADIGGAQAAEFLASRAIGPEAEAVRLEALTGLGKMSGVPGVPFENVLDVLRYAAVPSEPVAVQVRALEAIAALGRPVGSLQKSLKSPHASVRKAAVAAVARTSLPGEDHPLLGMLKDTDTGVRAAAIAAVGTLKIKQAIPNLLPLAADEATQFEAITALAQMPDRRALGAYLTGLTSKNQGLRQACRQAIGVLRDLVAPALEQLAKRNEIPTAALAELREVYSQFVPILGWRVIGPFPRDGKEHPPQKEQKFEAAYKGAEGEVKWRSIQADAAQQGRVNCASLFNPSQQVECFGFAEIESAAAREATLRFGSDDTIVVWVNGKKVFEFGGDRGWNADQDKVAVHLEKGKNRLLVKCGNSGGPWDFSVAVTAEADRYAFLRGAQKFNLEAFRAFARKTNGDAVRGDKLFRDLKGLACVKCHAVAGEGGQVGPDLAGIGLKYKREDLMTSVLEPSKVIAQGYETIVVTTAKGVTLTGVFKGENADAVSLADAEGKLHRILKKDIDERNFSPVSTMPNGLAEGMTLQDFADLMAYLESRREVPRPPKK
jgi:putative membrane-bound dehydrogenase-like protein